MASSSARLWLWSRLRDGQRAGPLPEELRELAEEAGLVELDHCFVFGLRAACARAASVLCCEWCAVSLGFAVQPVQKRCETCVPVVAQLLCSLCAARELWRFGPRFALRQAPSPAAAAGREKGKGQTRPCICSRSREPSVSTLAVLPRLLSTPAKRTVSPLHVFTLRCASPCETLGPGCAQLAEPMLATAVPARRATSSRACRGGGGASAAAPSRATAL